MQRFNWLLLVMIIVMGVIISSCKKDDSPTAPSGGATTYIGTLGNSNEGGVMTLNFASAPAKMSPHQTDNLEAIINVTGTVKFGLTTITLSGTYNTVNDSLIVSGGGYTFNGILSNGVLSGTYTGPNGNGSFTTEGSTAAGSIKVYAGTSHETSPDTSNHGRFLLVFKGTSIKGITESGLKLGGTLTGQAVSIHFESAPSVQIATGTVSNDGTSVSGTYTVVTGQGTVTGDWSGTLQ